MYQDDGIYYTFQRVLYLYENTSQTVKTLKKVLSCTHDKLQWFGYA